MNLLESIKRIAVSVHAAMGCDGMGWDGRRQEKMWKVNDGIGRGRRILG